VKQYCWEFFIVRSGTAHTGKNPVRSIDRPDDYENNEDGGGVFIDGRHRQRLWKFEKILKPTGKSHNKQLYVKWLNWPNKFDPW
jgi:hypothetical protein